MHKNGTYILTFLERAYLVYELSYIKAFTEMAQFLAHETMNLFKNVFQNPFTMCHTKFVGL